MYKLHLYKSTQRAQSHFHSNWCTSAMYLVSAWKPLRIRMSTLQSEKFDPKLAHYVLYLATSSVTGRSTLMTCMSIQRTCAQKWPRPRFPYFQSISRISKISKEFGGQKCDLQCTLYIPVRIGISTQITSTCTYFFVLTIIIRSPGSPSMWGSPEEGWEREEGGEAGWGWQCVDFACTVCIEIPKYKHNH